ncbi:MAG: RlmE family RNA methyltransferase [Gammaproteobacteria bacterium]
MARRKAVDRWIKHHLKDAFVRQSWRSGYRSRAVFKLQEIDDRDRLLDGVKRVVDLGASPGSWSQLVAQRVGTRGGVLLAVDRLPMEPIENVQFILGDVSSWPVREAIAKRLGSRGAELILSDMAPSLTGISAIDQAQGMVLAMSVLDLCERLLAPQGTLLIKVFQGEDYVGFLGRVKEVFGNVQVRKPRASRAQSREVYLLGRGYRRPSGGSNP